MDRCLTFIHRCLIFIHNQVNCDHHHNPFQSLFKGKLTSCYMRVVSLTLSKKASFLKCQTISLKNTTDDPIHIDTSHHCVMAPDTNLSFISNLLLFLTESRPFPKYRKSMSWKMAPAKADSMCVCVDVRVCGCASSAFEKNDLAEHSV